MIILLVSNRCIHCPDFVYNVLPNIVEKETVIIELSDMTKILTPDKLSNIITKKINLPMILYVNNNEDLIHITPNTLENINNTINNLKNNSNITSM